MGEFVGVVAVILTMGALPLLIIMHYVTKWKSTKGLSDEEQHMLEDLYETSERMMSRLSVLETILEEKSPGWREKD
jgi:phage shock protein B